MVARTDLAEIAEALEVLVDYKCGLPVTWLFPSKSLGHAVDHLGRPMQGLQELLELKPVTLHDVAQDVLPLREERLKCPEFVEEGGVLRRVQGQLGEQREDIRSGRGEGRHITPPKRFRFPLDALAECPNEICR